MINAHAELRPTYWWNTDSGRVAWWIMQHRRTNSDLSQKAVRVFWIQLVAKMGEAEARRSLVEYNVARPEWLD